MATGQIGYVYPGTPSHLQPVKTAKPPSSNNSSAPSTPPPQVAPSFFVSESLRMDILQKNALTLAQPDIVRFPDLPNEVDNYHELCPLEPVHKPASTVLGYQTSTYKATSIKTGTRYCLRRIHGEFKLRLEDPTNEYHRILSAWHFIFCSYLVLVDFRLANTKCMVLVDMWKRLSHTNLVQLREVFTTKAFGDHCPYFRCTFIYFVHHLCIPHSCRINFFSSHGFCIRLSPCLGDITE